MKLIVTYVKYTNNGFSFPCDHVVLSIKRPIVSLSPCQCEVTSANYLGKSKTVGYLKHKLIRVIVLLLP
jgi:hypothetical protein